MYLNISKCEIRISNHALERAKQRLDIPNIEKDTLLYEIKLLEIIKYNARFFHEDKNKLIYKFVYNNETYKLVVNMIKENVLLIETIIKV